jgi:STE24 endopeptidase
MDFYQVFIVAALLAKFLVDLASELLNLQSLRPDLPVELQTFYDPRQYSNSQEYTKARTGLGIAGSSFDLVLLLVFWFAGGFNRLDQLIRSLNFNPIITGILYIGAILLADAVLSIPFSIYATFVIEQKFGFNRTTSGTFVVDRLKALVLSIALGIPLLAAVLWFFQHAGGFAWLYCWIISAIFVLILQFVAPVWILPLFNKFTPLSAGELKNRIFQYAAKVGFAVKDIFVIDGSKRSSKANAFFTGFGGNRRIALYDTLIEQHTVPELVAVLAHEIGHQKRKHVLQAIAVGIVHAGIIFFLISIFLNNRSLFDAFHMEQVSVYGSLLFFGILYEPLSFILSILLNAFSRKHEREADYYAARTVDNPEDMVSALKKLSVKNLSNLTPHPLYVFLHYSHPTLLQRIESIRKRELVSGSIFPN